MRAFCCFLLALLSGVGAIHTVGMAGSACTSKFFPLFPPSALAGGQEKNSADPSLTPRPVASSGSPSVVDACGVCGGDGSSCACNAGYLGFSGADVNAGVLCHSNTELRE